MVSPIETYIRDAARARGIDPDTAVRVAMSEGGLNNPVRQSDVVNNGVRETSYGPFQLRIGGGLGDQALAAGIDPRDPNQWRKGVDFALDQVKRGGWGPWHGAAKIGITGMTGIGTPAASPTEAADAAHPGTTLTTTPAGTAIASAAPAAATPAATSGTATTPAPTTMKDKITDALGGLQALIARPKATPVAADANITTSSALTDDIGSRMAAAQQLMATLSMKKKGLSLASNPITPNWG